MVAWLVPIAVFWTLAALYVGGAAIKIEGPCARCQTLGLFLLFASYLGVYTVSGMALTGVAGAAFGGIVFPLLIASISIPLLTRVTFKLMGVSVSPQVVASPEDPGGVSVSPQVVASPEDPGNEGAKLPVKIISFLLPLVGLVLYLVWRDSKPQASKDVGYWALAAVIIGFVLSFFGMCTFLATAG